MFAYLLNREGRVASSLNDEQLMMLIYLAYKVARGLGYAWGREEWPRVNQAIRDAIGDLDIADGDRLARRVKWAIQDLATDGGVPDVQIGPDGMAIQFHGDDGLEVALWANGSGVWAMPTLRGSEWKPPDASALVQIGRPGIAEPKVYDLWVRSTPSDDGSRKFWTVMGQLVL